MTHYLGFVHSDVDEGATPGPADARIAFAFQFQHQLLNWPPRYKLDDSESQCQYPQ